MGCLLWWFWRKIDRVITAPRWTWINSPGSKPPQSINHLHNCARVIFPWWRHQMEAFYAQLTLCAGNSPVPVNSPHKGQWRGALIFSLIWIKRWVNNRGWWFETPSCPLWRHCNDEWEIQKWMSCDGKIQWQIFVRVWEHICDEILLSTLMKHSEADVKARLVCLEQAQTVLRSRIFMDHSGYELSQREMPFLHSLSP